MPITNFSISMKEYMRLVEEDYKKAQKDSVYGGLLQHLSELSNMMKQYTTKNASGEETKLSEADYKKLIDAYTAVSKDCKEFLSEDRSKNRLENRRLSMVKRLSSYVEKDLRGLIKADRTKESTLSDIVKESRVKTVDLTGKSLGHVGGALSSRIPLKSASGKEGFFTEKVTFEYNEPHNALVNRIATVLPEPWRAAYAGEKAELFNDTLIMYPVIDIHSDDPKMKEKSYQALALMLNTINDEMTIEEISNMLKEEKDLSNQLQEIHKEYMRLETQKEINNLAGISNNTRLDQRNSAMSDVAALLGFSGIIANSSPMQIIRDGKVIEGTFMEKAVGEDLNRVTKDSLSLQADKESFNHSEGLKQLANLQILDYICGNVDRHFANIMYQFEKDDAGKVILTGVCGIDNDASFGTRLFDDDLDGKDITPLSNINKITTSCVEALENISLDALRVVLADKLQVEEIDAVCQRVTNLIRKVKAKDIEMVPDALWGKEGYTYDKLNMDDVGLGKTIGAAIEGIQYVKENIEEHEKKATLLTYVEGKEVTNDAELQFKELFSKVEEFVSKAKETNGKFHKNSAEYKTMLTALSEVYKLGNSIDKKEVGMDKFKDFAEKIVELGLASQSYMDAKNLSQFTTRGKNRFELATEMRDLAQTNFAIKERTVSPEREAKQEDAALLPS